MSVVCHPSIPSLSSLPMRAPGASQAAYGGAFHGAMVVEQDLAMGERMRRILSELAPGRRVVVASTRAEAVNLLAALPYDLVLVDMRLPQNDGVSLIKHVRQTCPGAESVAMSAADDHDLVDAAISAGAAGYLLTEADDAELGFLLRSIERGGAPMDSRVARRLLGMIAGAVKPTVIAPVMTRPAASTEGRPAPGPLSPRELKVLRLIAQGWSNREIAEAVFLSINTVEFHAKSIYRKLSVKSRTQAVHEATQHGLLN